MFQRKPVSATFTMYSDAIQVCCINRIDAYNIGECCFYPLYLLLIP